MQTPDRLLDLTGKVAYPILFLVSPAASAINGTILDIDGGMLRR